MCVSLVSVTNLHWVVAAWLWSFESKKAEWWYIDEIRRLKVSYWTVNWLWMHLQWWDSDLKLWITWSYLATIIYFENITVYYQPLLSSYQVVNHWSCIFIPELTHAFLHVYLSIVPPLATLCVGAVHLQLLVWHSMYYSMLLSFHPFIFKFLCEINCCFNLNCWIYWFTVYSPWTHKWRF